MKDNTVNVERDALTGEKGRQEESPSGDSSRLDGPRLRRVRLKTLLRELVEQEGRMEAAEVLGVNYRTLVRAEETGQFTGRMRDALHRLMEPRQAPEVSRLAGRVTTLDWRVKRLETRLREMTLADAAVKVGASPTVGGASVLPEGYAAASVPGVGHRGPVRFRRRGVRRRLAVGGGVAATEGRPSQPRPHPAVADHGGSATDPGAVHDGTARAHPSPGKRTPPWLRTQGPDRLAVGGPSRHAQSPREEKDAASHFYPGVVAGIDFRPGGRTAFASGLTLSQDSSMGVSDLSRNAPKSLTPAKFGAITEFCFWLFPAFPAEKSGGFPSPESGMG